MHILASLVWIFGALVVLILGLARVVHDLLERTPLDSPFSSNKRV
jgi:hypothetical protein